VNIIRDGGSGKQLLVFDHTNPAQWAGIQTPGGSIEEGEDLIEGAKREAFEESGLSDFRRFELYAEDIYKLHHPVSGKKLEDLHRFFFVAEPEGETLDRWCHTVSGTGVDSAMEFEFFWLDLPAADGLEGHFRDHLEKLPGVFL
jgi:8-oxo-dGTP pyrophosphatase MutT (NUDIX family)